MTPRRHLLLAACAAPLALSGCASHSLADHQGQQPTLDLARYFNGTVLAHGMFQDRAGRVVKRFTVRIEGSWQGPQGVLDEHFVYADGSTQRRVWHLTLGPDGSCTGRADDVVGSATGRMVGNALNWRYTLRLPVDDSVYEVQFDDWMILVDERVMLNRATMSKFGITLGEVTLSFSRQP